MDNRPFRYSANRLAFFYVGLCVLCVGGLLWVGFLITARGLEREVDLVIATELDALRDEYDSGGLSRLVEALNRRTDSWGRTGAVYLLVDGGGNEVAGNLSGWPAGVNANEHWIEFDILARERGQDVDHPVRAEVVELGAYRLLVGTDVSERRRIARRLRDTTLWGIALAALLSALTGWWYSRRMGERVRVVARTCENIISGDLMRRLPLSGSRDEFDQLAVAVNHMLDRIEQQTATVRATFNSAAHDLRSPLHRIRVRLESALDGRELDTPEGQVIADSVDDLERVQRTLATLLQIAQADSASASLVAEAVDLSQLAHELGDLYEPEIRQRGLSWRLVSDRAAVIRGNRQLLAQLLANLLENALKYVPGGAHIELRIERDERCARLTVSDSGPGIPADARDAVLQPFHRLKRDDQLIGGSGLGLSLVAAVVRMHHGRLALRDNAPGLAVECEFSLLEAAVPPKLPSMRRAG